MDARGANRPAPTRRDRQSRWLDVVSGDRRGLPAALARAGLTVLAGVYRAGLAAANLRWRVPGAVRRAPCPVVSVGNLTVGGTGKTPMVAWLARQVVAEGGRPLIISRGYGAESGTPNEEARELAERCPGVPHVQYPDRLRAIRDWTASRACDVAILDDGFQHRRLHRELDIVLVDALRPFGYGHVLPRGLLREPPSALHRADVAVLTRAELLDAAGLARLKKAVSRYLRPGVPLLVAEHRPEEVVFADGSRREASWLRGQPVLAVCAIANPEAFRQTLDRLGAHVVRLEAFRDHYPYTSADLDRLAGAARAAGSNLLVTTRKDFVKWRPLLAERRDGLTVDIAVLGVTVCMTEGEGAVRDRLRTLLRPAAGPGEP